MLKLLKKILIFTLIFLSSFFVIKDVAFADESETTEYNYSIYFKDNPTDSAKQSGSYVENTFQLTFSTDYEICAYWEKVATSIYRISFIKKDNSGTITSNLIFCAAVFVQISNSYDFSNHYIKYYNNAISKEVINGNDGVNGLYIDYYSEPGNLREDVLSTTFPIFTNEEMALGYMNGDISISDSVNFDDLINISYDSTDVPVPHDLKVTEENSKYFISWSQTAEELPFITEVSYRRHIDALQITHDVEGAYPTYPNKPELFYNPLLLHKYDITDEILNIVKFYREKCGVDSFKCSYVIRIRNKYVKSEIEIVYSNVVRAVLTISYDVNTGIKINAEYEEKNESGDFVPDSSYNDYGDGSGLIRDDIGAASGSSVSVGNFISNIVNGFGLLGDNGVISMMSSVFLFLPTELWALIYMMVSLFLVVALFKLVVK